MRLVTSERAKQDIEDIVLHISLDNPQSAERFRTAFDNLCERLLDIPEIGSHRGFYNPMLNDLRMLPLRHFENYLIFYRADREDKKVEVIRVVHGARHLPALFE
jgi:plasmid stabilization system protein ParE